MLELPWCGNGGLYLPLNRFILCRFPCEFCFTLTVWTLPWKIERQKWALVFNKAKNFKARSSSASTMGASVVSLFVQPKQIDIFVSVLCSLAIKFVSFGILVKVATWFRNYAAKQGSKTNISVHKYRPIPVSWYACEQVWKRKLFQFGLCFLSLWNGFAFLDLYLLITPLTNVRDALLIVRNSLSQ